VPRIPPLEEAQWPERARELLERGLGGSSTRLGENNIFTTLCRHEELFRAWMRLGSYLLTRGVLDPRVRELLILRTACNCGSSYEWGQHVRISEAIGMSREQIMRIAHGSGAAGLSSEEEALLRAADELHEHASISEQTWQRLAAFNDERALIEITMLVGHYHMVAFALNSLEVELDPGLEALPGS
jgi:alkylhydroperoxidase family enzyme